MRSVNLALVVIAATVSLGVDKCQISWPQPQPSPSPTVEPTPTPTPEPTTPPTPEPTAPPTPGACTVPLTGTPMMGAYFLYPRVVDSTPKLTDAQRCTAIGMPGRITCPVTAEGDPQRYACEVKLIGGPHPAYELEVYEEPLAFELEDEWKARVFGKGKGRIRSCYPNGRACSKWLEVK